MHEVFYNEDGSIYSWTADPVYPLSESLEELTEEFERYRRALSEPVLDEEELEKLNGRSGSPYRQMTLDEARKALEFSEEWRTLGIVTPERIDQLALEFSSGDDPNPEHYRYRAFQDFLNANRPLSPELAEALYRLGDRDPDGGMGGAIMIAILYLEECPVSLRQAALASGRKHLVKEAQRWLS